MSTTAWRKDNQSWDSELRRPDRDIWGAGKAKPMESYNELYLRQAEHFRRLVNAAKNEQRSRAWLLLADLSLRIIRDEGSNVVQDHFDTQPSTERAPP